MVRDLGSILRDATSAASSAKIPHWENQPTSC